MQLTPKIAFFLFHIMTYTLSIMSSSDVNTWGLMQKKMVRSVKKKVYIKTPIMWHDWMTH